MNETIILKTDVIETNNQIFTSLKPSSLRMRGNNTSISGIDKAKLIEKFTPITLHMSGYHFIAFIYSQSLILNLLVVSCDSSIVPNIAAI